MVIPPSTILRRLMPLELAEALLRAYRRGRSVVAGWRGWRDLTLVRRATETGEGPLVLVKARNEERRIERFLAYYRRLGAGRFVVIDNGSTDRTVELALREPRCEIHRTGAKLGRSMLWMQAVLNRTARGQWALIVDVDEMLVYPGQDRLDLRHLCRYLEGCGATAMGAVMLDMYPEGPVRAADLVPGADPLALAPFFDAPIERDAEGRPRGGVRKRVFGLDPLLYKAVLVRHRLEHRYGFAFHYVFGARLAQAQGALLHFKFFAHELARFGVERERGVYWKNGEEYAAYAAAVARDPNLCLTTSGSKRYHSAEKLVRDGIVREDPRLSAYGASPSA